MIDKQSGKILMFDYFYGDPSCGLIGSDNSWAIIAGEHLTIWRADRTSNQQIKRIKNDELKWIHDIRLKTEDLIEILTDPWSERSAIWELNLNNDNLIRIKDFKNYLNQEYSDNLNW